MPRLAKNNKNEVTMAPKVLTSIQDALIQEHAELIVKGLLDEKARDELKHYVAKEHGYVVKGNEEMIDYIVQETVGTGIVERIVKREPGVTDIWYNGTDLIIKGNNFERKYEGSTEITEDYIISIIQKFASAVEEEFSSKSPTLNAVFENMRLNAVHNEISKYGTSMSLRISKPKLVFNKDNFNTFAPDYMYDFFRAAVKLQSNIVISGEVGTGKTELQKLLISFIPFEEKIIMIEDVLESHVKEMFPDKDITSWLTSKSFTITDALKESVRNNPVWIMVSETRGAEAYEMIQIAMSGHHIITSVHAIGANEIPRRFVNMSKMGHSISEKSLEEDIRRDFDFGVHVEKIKYKGLEYRYLAEVIEFGEEENIPIFEQRFIKGKLHSKAGKLSDKFKRLLMENNISLDFPERKEIIEKAKIIDIEKIE